MSAARFRARLEPVSHGGHFVIVPSAVAKRAGLGHGARVRGEVNGAPYRSSLMKYSGVFHLGVHKATLARAGASGGERVEVTIEIDDQPLPTDIVPGDLASALAGHPGVRATWDKLAPAQRRERVTQVIEAKKAETRARRIAKIVDELRAGVPRRRTWTPPAERAR